MHRATVLAAIAAAAAAAVVPFARAASPDTVVSQVYAGGGNAGATFTNDFVELFNRGSSAVDLTGWTVQYASASAASWQATPLAGSLAPGRHYLVQLGSTASVGAALPTPDATGTTNLAASGGKVALVHGTTALACGASAGSCAASVVDLIGYGSASDYEGAAAAPALDSTTAALRAGAGCTDTDSSTADFTVGTPLPRNTQAAVVSCSGTTPPPASGTSQNAAVDLDVEPVLTLSLERAAISFGQAVAGTTPAPVSERVTVTSNDAAGYALTVHRTAFTPGDLPLGLSATAPAGGQLGGSLGGGLVPIPIAPAADLLIGTTAAATGPGGAQWPTSVGFAAPLPAVASGRYAATLTFTAIGR
ncbi:MAG TPA: lamin tail domain-containing protein [Gaiellaceae bacterium]|nr:lamin tail domain-containing protein [Gaiellaceae bacterium]